MITATINGVTLTEEQVKDAVAQIEAAKKDLSVDCSKQGLWCDRTHPLFTVRSGNETLIQTASLSCHDMPELLNKAFWLNPTFNWEFRGLTGSFNGAYILIPTKKG